MKHEVLSEEVQSTAALYALGALSQSEARAFEAHLEEGCENCLRELGGFEEVAGLLGLASAGQNPPEYLRDMLALRIDNEEDARQSEMKSAGPARPPSPGQVAKLEPKESRRKRTWARDILPWAIAASLLIGLTASLILWRADRRSREASIAQARQRSEEMESELVKLSEELLKREAELTTVNTVLESPRLSVIAMKGQAESGEPTAGKIYWDEHNNTWVVSAKLPPPPPGMVYQLWFVTPDEKISAGLLDTDTGGQGYAILDGPGDRGNLSAAAVTLEPAGGSPQPTSAIYLMGQPGS